jgi:N-acetyl-anhydromuramyl-L-alanine amidase AmpD
MKVPGFRFVQAAGSYTDKDGRHYGVAIHATANTATDTAEASYASHRTDGTSGHAYVDADSLTQALDTDRKAGHAGSAYGNENAIAVEITGLNSWTRERWLSSVAWDELARWLAYIIRNDPDYAGFQVRRATVAEMIANPRVQAFYGHDDMRRAWGGTDHTDPGPNFPWDRLLMAVAQALHPAARPGDDEEDSMGASLGPIEIPVDNFGSFSIPPVEAGAADPRPAWFNITNDTFGEVYAIRLAMGDGNGGWDVKTFTLGSNARQSIPLKKGVCVLSVARMGLDENGMPVGPHSVLLVTPPYAGPLTFCIERGPVVR